MFCCTKSQPSTSSTLGSREFQLSDILEATNNLDESLIIGSGFYGAVYKGEVFIGAIAVPAAIRRLKHDSIHRATESWPWSEVERLSTMRHTNLVSLLGYCHYRKQVQKKYVYEEEIFLVYEYVRNGNLKYHLHEIRTPLSWLQRLSIALGIARGLQYLHTDTGVHHADIRSSNVLLTHTWAPKISNFGMSELGPGNDAVTSVFSFSQGSLGYFDHFSLIAGKLTRKSDVLSFGVVLLELLCRKAAVEESPDGKRWSLLTWFGESAKEKKLLEDLIDSAITNEISPTCLHEFLRIVEGCLQPVPHQRPDMTEVVTNLESLLVLQERHSNLLQRPFPSDSGDPTNSNGNTKFAQVPVDSESPSPSVKKFAFDDLEKATKGFSRDLLLGEGKVFLGWIDRDTLAPSEEAAGIVVAVKWITLKSPRLHSEWLEEVNFVGQLAHRNIIRLLGYCSTDGHEHLLVYEHKKKSLSHFIHGDEPLSWGARLNIMIGVARGLTYLYTTKGVLCHFQFSDILLDEDFNAKLGGFGWVKMQGIRLNGGFGYLKAYSNISTGDMSTKNGTCSFGLVLLETITGRCLGDFKDALVLGLDSLDMRDPKSKSNRRKVKEMMDPRLKDNYSPEGAFKCMALALRCIAIRPEYRPTKEEILWSLEQIHTLNK